MNDARSQRRPPPQFGLKAIFGITVAVALLLSTLRWLGVPPFASAVVLVVLVVSAAAALGLVIALAGPWDDTL